MVSADKNQTDLAPSLKELVNRFLKAVDVAWTEDQSFYGRSGQERKVEYFVPENAFAVDEASKHVFPKGIGLIVKEWNRSVGYNVVQAASEAERDCSEIEKIFLVSQDFSTSARDWAKKSGVTLISRDDLIAVNKKLGQL
ncbi:MAG: restriction endonuclease [Candidatus Hodarchaeota archaeon]